MRGMPPVERMCDLLAVLPYFEKPALLVCEEHLLGHHVLTLG